MSTVNVLFELGTEELPAHAVKNFPQQLQQLLAKDLDTLSLTYKNINVYATPRRMAVYIQDLLDRQPDRILEKQGPQEKAAFNEKGDPTQAGLGFARSCNIEPSQLKNYIENGRLIYKFTQKGVGIEEILPAHLVTCIKNLQAGKTMRWGETTCSFVRPVRWIVFLINDKLFNHVLFNEYFGIKETQRSTYGHRFLSPGKIDIKHADHYVKQLEVEGNVLVDQQERRKKIEHALYKYVGEKNLIPYADDNLVSEVTGLVEWPVELLGEFSKIFLELPEEVIISAMKNHQKCFALHDEHAKLSSSFIIISNLESKKPEQVIHGNERVMNARLSDAAFFFNTDKQTKLADRLNVLRNILYQEKLGSLYDKTQRVIKLSEQLADNMKLNKQECTRAGLLSLCDLSTLMVQEFPELQGLVGSYYATNDGESEDVCIALIEQYYPQFSGDKLPTSSLGQMLAIAHRLDTLAGQFAVGNKPSGDKDPFALRRQAQGLMRILVNTPLDLNLPKLFEQSLLQLPIFVRDPEELIDEIWKFCLDRLRALYLEHNINIEVFNAILNVHPVSPYDFNLRLHALEKFRDLPAANSLIAAHKRVKNILSKTEIIEEIQINDILLKEEAEKQLAKVLKEKSIIFEELIQQHNYQALLNQLADLRPHIDRFFDHVMVMVDDPEIRQNRLALLNKLHYYLGCAADISELAGMATT